MLEGRKQVLPEDLQAIIPATIAHRLQPIGDAEHAEPMTLVESLLDRVPVP
jgi:MoxR-like ATPase